MDTGNRSIRIGCSSAFWGDTPHAARQLVHKGGHLDYLVSDYLAEITMCILARMKQKVLLRLQLNQARGGAGEGGFVKEFVDTVWRPLMKDIMQKKIKLVTNAGGNFRFPTHRKGMNPVALKKAIEQVAREAGMEVPIVAAVTGDDLTPELDKLKDKMIPFSILGEEEKMFPDDQLVMSCNAYLGAMPIVAALQQGAQIVVTGRCVDSALILGPLIFEFGWKATDFDLLSAGSLAGHLVECGCQVTGGNFTDWELSSGNGWDDAGFPIAECFADGKCIISKPEGTGGAVTVGTVGEQLLYEIGDPSAYILPDVICDWTQVRLTQLPPVNPNDPKPQCNGQVLVEGAKGRSPTEFVKVAVTTFGGYRLNGSLAVGGINAVAKAKAVAEALFRRSRRLLQENDLPPFFDTAMEILGAEHS